jgi:hypothetical protein
MLRPLSAGLIALAVASTVAGYVAPSAASTFAAGSSTALCIRGRAVCGAARHCSQVAGLSMQDVSTRSVKTTDCFQLHHCIAPAAAYNMCTASQFFSAVATNRCLLYIFREGSEPRVSSSSADAGRPEGARGPGGDRGNFRSDSRGPSDRSVHLLM